MFCIIKKFYFIIVNNLNLYLIFLLYFHQFNYMNDILTPFLFASISDLSKEKGQHSSKVFPFSFISLLFTAFISSYYDKYNHGACHNCNIYFNRCMIPCFWWMNRLFFFWFLGIFHFCYHELPIVFS